MISKSRWVEGRFLRCGYTTGSCAAGAAKAAAIMLEKQKILKTVSIVTPSYTKLDLEVLNPRITKKYAQCAIQKDSGDDPDVTDGVHVVALVRYQKSESLTIESGEGIGRITREGLGIPIGQSAISNTPRKMIQQELLPFIKPGKGIHLTLSVPGGETIACKTLNPRLGIEGGISIIGTTGIVDPMSREAFIHVLFMEIDMVLQETPGEMTLVFGNYGKQFFKNHFGVIEDSPMIKFGNFLGDVLDYVKNKNVTSIRLVGHIGKMIKVAGGIFNTKNSIADARMEIFAALAAAVGVTQTSVQSILEAVTTEAALALIPETKKEMFISLCLKRIANYLRHRLGEQTDLQLIMFSLKSGLLGQLNDPGMKP
jgi:cobalt-precorrin-5B (C1)-methyltransferase